MNLMNKFYLIKFTLIWYKSNLIKQKYYMINLLIKYSIFILLYFILFCFKHIYINLKEEIKIDIDNKFDISLYENNINFSNYISEIKPIAIYYLENTRVNKLSKNIMKSINDTLLEKINLAKSHGIYGFAVYYDLEQNENNFLLDFLIENKNHNFSFLLIWKNENFQLNIKDKSFENELNHFVKIIKKYLISSSYIKINDMPALSISNPFIFQNIKDTIFILREKAKENRIGKIFIFAPLNELFNKSDYFSFFDAIYDLSKLNFIEKDKKYQKISYYSGMIYKNILLNQIYNNFTFFRTSIIEIENHSINNILKDYSLEKYFILNNIIIEWTKINYKKTNGFIFINSWNNYLEGNYLEPDVKYGYASINSFSRALFNISSEVNYYNILYLNKKCLIAIQVHVYYEDLIYEIINKTNNIPTKFDLFISTINSFKKEVIEKAIKNNSKSNKYEIKIVENKGRDVLPFIIQMRFKIKKYKYFCHLHTKKSKHDIYLGVNWRNYLYDNILGNKKLISEILNDFEKYERLGFIFPEVYYDIIKQIDNYDYIDFPLHKPNVKYMNFILKNIFHGYTIGEKIIFPSGDMFWAKVNAIYQIFQIKFIKKFPKELNQTNETIMHGIERIWLYLVKLNGYYYKVIFSHY